MKKVFTSIAVGCFMLAAWVTAAAANEYVPPFDGQQMTLNDGVAYLSGGVGITERTQMNQMDQSYNLKLIFDVRNGDYLSNVAIKIQNKSGHVLVNTVSEGPWFCAKLPAGTYKVTGYFDGHTVIRTISVRPQTRDILMTWSV